MSNTLNDTLSTMSVKELDELAASAMAAAAEGRRRAGVDLGFTFGGNKFAYNRTTSVLTVREVRDSMLSKYQRAADLMNTGSTAEREGILGFMQALSNRIATA